MVDLATQGGALVAPKTPPSGSPFNISTPFADKMTGPFPVSPSIAPTLSAQFKPAPTGTQKSPAVVTSEAATNHVNEMDGATKTALTEAQLLALHNVQKAFAASQPTETKPEESGSSTPNTDTSGVDSILQSLGLGADGEPGKQQSDIVKQDEDAILQDQQRQTQTNDALTSMEAGSFPLTAAEQTQVNAVRGSYTGVLNAANDYASNVLGGAHVLLAKNEMQKYSPQYAIGEVQTAIKIGQAKVETVNNQIVSSMAKLTTALQDVDYKTATRLYQAIGDDIKTRQSEIDSINKTVTATQTELLKANIAATTALDKTRTEILTAVSKSNAPQSVRDAVANAKDLSSMFNAAGSYMQAGTGTGILSAYSLYQAQATAMGKTPMDILSFSQIYNKAPKAPSPTSGINLVNNPAAQSTPEKLNWVAQFGISGGNVPSPYGKSAAGQPMNTAYFNVIADNAMKLGISGPQMAAIFNSKQSAEKALVNVSKAQAIMLGSEHTAESNFDLIAKQLQDLPNKTFSPLVNSWVQSGQVQTGDPNIKPIAALLTTALNEYAKVITANTSGAAVSDSAREEVHNMINITDPTNSMLHFFDLAKQEMGNRVTGFDDSKQMLYGVISDRFGDVNVPGLTDVSATDQALSNTPTEEEAQAAVGSFYQSNPSVQPTIEQMITDGVPYSKIQEWLQGQ